MTVLFSWNPVLENLLLISSCTNTLLVLHLVKSVNTLFDNSTNLELLVLVSKSREKSKLLIASTLCLSSKPNTLLTSRTIKSFVIAVIPTPTVTLLSIEVSEKFFNPAGWTRRFTGFTNLSHSTELLTV